MGRFELDLADDPRVAKVLSHPAGRVGFAAVFGLLFFETLNNFRGLVAMGAAWQQHTDPGRTQLHRAPVDEFLPPLSWSAPECVIGADPLDVEGVPRGETPTVDP